MWKRHFLGALTLILLVTVAACPPRDRVDEPVAEDTIVPATPPEVVPIPREMPADTPLMVDTPMVRDTPAIQTDTPRVEIPGQP